MKKRNKSGRTKCYFTILESKGRFETALGQRELESDESKGPDTRNAAWKHKGKGKTTGKQKFGDKYSLEE